MGLEDLDIKEEYRSLKDNIIEKFYIPLLERSISYKRAVGFFSSSSLAEIAVGIKKFVENTGKIKLIASPKLSEKDMEDIELGYKIRDELIKEKLFRRIK